MSGPAAVRWAILGTANIARAQFLPALREAGGGRAVLVAGRDAAVAGAWAEAQGVEAAAEGYEAAVESPDVDAVYVALPNSLHATWTRRALAAGKAVLCEKPLCVDVAETRSVLEEAREPGRLVWEAFVFPFQAQHNRVVELLDGGAVGEVREIVSSFHFRVSRPTDIRLSAELGGGALADVGCYPIRFAQEILAPLPDAFVVRGLASGTGEVESEAAGVVGWGDRRLLLSCGFQRAYDTFTRILGTEGQLDITNPFHPRPSDTISWQGPGRAPLSEAPTTDSHSFTAALRHIHRVLAGDEAPRHLAVDDSAPTARVLAALTQACRPFA
jgi:predicted dehydrogenase